VAAVPGTDKIPRDLEQIPKTQYRPTNNNNNNNNNSRDRLSSGCIFSTYSETL
jgi:hypothetical protein